MDVSECAEEDEPRLRKFGILDSSDQNREIREHSLQRIRSDKNNSFINNIDLLFKTNAILFLHF